MSSDQIPTPVEDEPNDSNPQQQIETLAAAEEPKATEEGAKATEEEAQTQNQIQNQQAADQEQSKSNLEENPEEEISLPPAIHVSCPPMAGGGGGEVYRRSYSNKRKKGKFFSKKQQGIVDKKLTTLLGSLNPIPFRPAKILDFSKHESLMKSLRLWDFVHIEFDEKIRVDLIAQLVASYDQKLRCGYVNDYRISVTKADLGRALKLVPFSGKDKGVPDMPPTPDSYWESLSDESVVFVEEFLSNWVLLHEDAWIMPSEVLRCSQLIKDKQPNKVDWAALFWTMVLNELVRGEQLEDCYYASHLQCLIKYQRKELFIVDEPEKIQKEEGSSVGEAEKVQKEEELSAVEPEKVQEVEDLSVEEPVKVQHEDMLPTEEPDKMEVQKSDVAGDESDAKVGVVSENQEEGALFKEPNIELTLGQQDDQEMEDVKGEEIMEFEEHEEEMQEERVEREGPILQSCNMKEASGLDESERTEEETEALEEEEDDDDEEREDGFGVLPNVVDTLGDDGLAENLLQTMETTQIAFNSDGHGHLRGQSSVDMAARADLNSGGLFFDHGTDNATHSQGANKRLRMDDSWDHKQSDYGTCMEQVHQWLAKASMIHEAKEKSEQECTMYNQYYLNEIEKRDHMIERIHKTRNEEIQKRDQQIYRLERELFMMGNILEGYRKALKATHKNFAEYRQRVQLPEEPIYCDAGPGGLVLTVAEVEKLRLKQEEEYRSNCLMLELKAKEAEEGYAAEFNRYMETVLALDNKLTSLKDNFKNLKELRDKRKAPETTETTQEIANDAA